MLSEGQLALLAEHGEERRAEVGDVLFRVGDRRYPLGRRDRPLQDPTVPFAPCPEMTSSSATELPSGGSSTRSSSNDGESASEATF